MDAFRKISLLGAFWLLVAIVQAQDCNYNGQSNKFTPVGLCAPVAVTWDVDYSNVVLPVGATIDFEFVWDDGSPSQFITPTLLNAATNTYGATANHVYAKDPVVQKCVYQPSVRYWVNGQPCTNSQQLQTIKVYNTDNKNSNQDMVINPEVYTICVGNDGTVTFKDESIWNCEPPDQQIQDGPNDRKRWIQWIYGTNASDGKFIGDALVNGIPRTFPFSGPIDMTNEPIYNPMPPWNTTMPIYVNNTRLVNDWFEVELRNWNQCNPYDDPAIPGPPADPINGDFPPITKRAIIIIVPNPDATITPAGPFCANSPNVTLKAATNGGTWSGTGITNASTGRFSPSNAGPGTHTITYTVTSANGCTDTDTEVFTVNAIPQIDITSGPQTNLCPGAIVQLNGNPSGGLPPYTHLWTGDTSPLNNTAIQAPDFQTTTVGKYNLQYTATDNNGCKNTAPTEVNVSFITVTVSDPFIEVCTNVPVALNPEPSGGSGVYVFHQWSGPNVGMLSDPNIANPVFNASAVGSYIFSYYVRDSQGCEATTTIKVDVNDVPVANAGTDATVCGLSHMLNAVPSIGIGKWTQLAGPGTATFANASSPTGNVLVDAYGSYLFQWKEDNKSCADSAQVSITFVRIPTPKVMEDASLCGLSIELKSTPDIGGVWSQISGPGSSIFASATSATTTVAVDMPGTYVYRWFEDNGFGCEGSDDVTVQFYPLPTAVLAPLDTLGCTPYEVAFVNTSTNADNYFWDFGDGTASSMANPTHIFENLTPSLRKYKVTHIVSNSYGCADTLSLDIWVAPSPRANFKPDKIKGCSPLTVNFINQSNGATTYSWNFGDGSAASTELTPTHMFTNNNDYVLASEVTLAVANNYNCVDTARAYISVYPALSIDFTAIPEVGCDPLRVDFLADAGAYTYQWNFGDGAQLSGTPVATRVYLTQNNVQTKYTVTLNTSSAFGCTDVSTKQITVNPSPIANILPDKTEGCHPLTVNFANTSTSAVKAWWKLENGDVTETSGNGPFSYQFTNTSFAPIWYKIVLVVENAAGCRDSVEQRIQVFPDVGASIQPADPGCSPHAATFLNATTGGRTFVWDYGDGNSSSGYVGANIYTVNSASTVRFDVRMVATSVYGCQDTAFTYVDVHPTPKAAFDADPTLQTMPESTVTFTNKTEGLGWQFNWRFGDGETSTVKDPVHTYNASGTYSIWLKAQGEHCKDSTLRVVQILPMVPNIVYGPPSEGCPPLTVEFYNETTDATSFLWEFGDNNSSTAREPVHTYVKPGTYNVKLTADGPGGRAVANDLQIVVYEVPVAFFDLDPRVTVIPDESVRFKDLSTGTPVSWTWDFGDGNGSSDQNPMHKYTAEGVYDVKLIVVNSKGCQSDYLLTEAVRAKTGGTIAYPNAFTPSTSGPSGGVYDKYDRNNYVFFPFTQEGIVEYNLQIFNRWGELLFESNDVNIGWDGYVNGRLSSMGVYIWKAKVKFSDGSTNTFSGDVTLLR
jgi:gliding motility-associated-like protein